MFLKNQGYHTTFQNNIDIRNLKNKLSIATFLFYRPHAIIIQYLKLVWENLNSDYLKTLFFDSN